MLFTRPLDPHQMSFAFTETLAHVNRLVRRGELKTVPRDGKLVTVPATDSKPNSSGKDIA
ncbi:hypothetical protein ACFSZS_27415 [Seohaeicola zhoushanensis]